MRSAEWIRQFMQRKQQADLVAQQLKEEASQREAAHWVVSNPQAAVIPPTYSHHVPSHSLRCPLVHANVVHRAVVADEQVVTGVRSGRMSFGQFNPSIEVRCLALCYDVFVRRGRLHLSTPFVWFQELHHGPKETKIEEKDTLEWSAVYRNQEKAKQEEMGRYAS